MSDDRRMVQRISVASHEHLPLWAVGWLFTIGYLKLAFWKAVLAVVIWPYYIGAAVR
ncbi:MAG TPA: hypothetical protein VM221_01500 [Armatimonadota bacterium]|nr:hypothetical protein [Armatimonadota bacterium]